LQLTTHPWDIYSDIQGLKFNAIVSGNNIQRMVISGGGSVGIGVTTPQAKLHVGQDILAEGDITTRDKLVLSPGSLGRDSWEISRTNNGLNFVYRISSTNNNILFLDNNGHIGVGKTNPSSALDVNGTATVNELRAQSATIANALTAGSAAITGTTQLTGNVGIGTAPAQEKLNVNGSFKATNADITNTLIAGTLTSKGALNAQTATINGTVTADALNAESAKISGRICAKEVRVAVSGGPCWPDFVFAKDYKLPTLNEVEQFINENQHLPNVPSAAEVEANGIELGEMNAILLRKVEELTLYIIQMEKRLSEIESKKIVVSG
ncbi:MAG: hypothetical protein FWC34_04895, partial [Bacteroidetes bacterium]|nr:hypothetical protein [Bacteroidota bacterium]MCL2303228.1 hypothetical protein [Lentimicrobiaceae bacterium]